MKKKPLEKFRNELKSKEWFNLSLVLSIWSFILLLSVAIVGFVTIHVVKQFGYIKHPIPGWGLITMMLICLITGTAEAIFIHRRSTRFITHINKAMDEVAHGNLDIQLDEDYYTEEFRGMSVSFNKMVQELSTNEMYRSDFITNVSHEFKTPLSAIEGYATLLQDDSLSAEEREEYLKKITDTTRRLSDMTGNILMLSRLETQKITPLSTEFELDEQIRCAILELESLWSEKNLELDIELDSVKCVAPKELIYHVWLNLISNAIKFTEPFGTISMQLNESDQSAVFSISDTGIGLSSEEQKHVFERFYQADRSHNSKGNGLGLALVKHIVGVCDGTVSVESEKGVGSIFTVTIPRIMSRM